MRIGADDMLEVCGDLSCPSGCEGAWMWSDIVLCLRIFVVHILSGFEVLDWAYVFFFGRPAHTST